MVDHPTLEQIKMITGLLDYILCALTHLNPELRQLDEAKAYLDKLKITLER